MPCFSGCATKCETATNRPQQRMQRGGRNGHKKTLQAGAGRVGGVQRGVTGGESITAKSIWRRFLSARSSHLAADYSHDLDGIKVGMVRKCHFTLLLPRFTNLSSSRFQRRNPSICFVSKAPCILVRIARIFAVPREPTTRRYHRVSVSSLSLGYL
jgi:hypothetical protein